MITKILLHAGGYHTAFDFQRFCTLNADRLLEKGIVYPTTLLATDRGFLVEHTKARILLCNFASSPLTERLYSELRMLHQEHNGRDQASTLVFSMPDLLQRQGTLPLVASDLHVFRTLFPQAEIDALLVLSRQDQEYESRVSYQALIRLATSPAPHGHLASLSPYHFDYGKLWRSFQESFGPDHCTLFIDQGGERKSVLESLLKQLFGLDDLSGFAMPPPFPYAMLPQDVLWFVHLYAAAVSQTATENLLDRSREKAFLEGGELPPRVLNPWYRKWLLRGLAARNAEFAREHGQGNFCSEEVDDKEWKPFTGFTPDHASRLASLLSAGAAQEYLRVIEAIPPVERPPLLRDVERGLRAALSLGPPAYLRERQARVTVLTMCYNHEKYIEAAIKGVLAQETNFPVEHVIADDGSADGSREIILDYAARHPGITPLFRSRHRNASREGKLVHRLFSMAKSPYVSLCDGDDYFCDPQKLQRQVDFLDANPRYSLCFHPVYMLWENRAQEGRIFPDASELPPHGLPYTLTDLVRWNFMSSSSVMYRWRFAGGLPSWFYADALPGDWYWHMLHAETGRIGMLPKAMSVYRRHDGGIWIHAETDQHRHKKLYGMKELRTYEIMNAHFQERFVDLFTAHIHAEFAILDELAEHGDPELLTRAIREFPDWAGRVLEYIRK